MSKFQLGFHVGTILVLLATEFGLSQYARSLRKDLAAASEDRDAYYQKLVAVDKERQEIDTVARTCMDVLEGAGCISKFGADK